MDISEKKYSIQGAGKSARCLHLLLCAAVLIWLMTGCRASSPYYKHSEGKPDRQEKKAAREDPQYTLFFIGDTGAPSLDPPEPNLRVLQHHLQSAGKNSAVVFLGDNIYSYGLRPEDHSERKESERRIDSQLKMLKDYRGRPIFIPGNHDWNDDRPGGWEAIKRQQHYIEERLGPTGFMPDNGCPGPIEVRLDSANVLLALDTEWWIYPHQKPGLAECKNGNNEQFVAAVDSLITGNRRKNVFVVGHHPFYSNGTHNGYFPVTEHLFPLLKYSSVLYIPLPVIGSINPLYRKYIGYRQDLAGKEYRQLREELVNVFSQYPNLVYAAGHDHSLQYHPIGNQHYIVSGSGTVDSYVRKGKSVAFAFDQKGFARIDVFEDEVWLSFWIPASQQPQGQMVYQKKLYNRPDTIND